MKEFEERSLKRLSECDPDLQKLAEAILQRLDVIVTCGHRGEAEQDKAFKEGKSKAKFGQSKHNSSPSKAVDFAVKVDGKITWERKYYEELGRIAKEEASKLGISIKWGGDFKSIWDGPHIELA